MKIQLRFKFNLIYSIFSPFLPIFMSLIVLMRFFVADVTLGQWNDTNYLVFLFTAFQIELPRRIIQDFPDDFRLEKYWKTLPALMIAPFNKVHLLFGVFIFSFNHNRNSIRRPICDNLSNFSNCVINNSFYYRYLSTDRFNL